MIVSSLSRHSIFLSIIRASGAIIRASSARCIVSLYPEIAFTDTGILQTYRDELGDRTVRTVSIGHSWTLKVCSGVRVYGESNHLAFFMKNSSR